jgi:hypothetical protein
VRSKKRLQDCTYRSPLGLYIYSRNSLCSESLLPCVAFLRILIVRSFLWRAFWLLVLFHPLVVRAQSLPGRESVRSRGLAGALVGFGQAAPLDANPALAPLDSDRSFWVQAMYTPNIAGLEHSNQVIGSTVAAGFARYGYNDLFSDQTIALSLQHSFSLFGERAAHAGIRARYQTLQFGGVVAPISSLLFDAGMQFSVTNAIGVGVAGQNLLGAQVQVIDGSSESFERSFDAGFSYQPTDGHIAIGAAIHSIVGDHTRGRFCAEYLLEDFVVLRVGALTDPSVITGGVGLRYHGFAIDAAAEYSPLNTALTFGLSWQW